MKPYTRLLDTFSNRNCHREHEKSKTSYLPTIPNSREYPVCKTYPHFLLDTIEAPELPYIFLPADEQVSTGVLHIIWKHKDLYSKIIPIMDGFYQMRVFQRVLEGRHYYRSAHLHREGFDAFDQRRAEDITNKFEFIHLHFLNNLSGLR